MKYQSWMPEHYLEKSKKYFRRAVQLKDKQNIIYGDIHEIVKKLSLEHSHPDVLSLKQKYQNYRITHKSSIYKKQLKLIKDIQLPDPQIKSLKEELNRHLNTNYKVYPKANFFQEYLKLVEQSSDYIDYYTQKIQASNPSFRPEPRLLKNKGKQIIICILKHHYDFNAYHSPQVATRIHRCLNISGVSQFGWFDWAKYLKMRKIMCFDFSRRQAIDFITDYFFSKKVEYISKQQFESVVFSVFRKFHRTFDEIYLSIIRKRFCLINERLINNSRVYRTKFEQQLNKDSVFIWNEFVRMIFAVQN